MGGYSYSISGTIIEESIRRINVMNLLEILWDNLPEDAIAVVAITMEDIYESPSDILMGRATGDGAAVISLNRFNTSITKDPKIFSSEKQIAWLSRVLPTIAHEVSHILGIDHCTYCKCLMNAWVEDLEVPSSSVDQPYDLCPIDLQKLQHSLKFDIKTRFLKLFKYYSDLHLTTESNWFKKQLK